MKDLSHSDCLFYQAFSQRFKHPVVEFEPIESIRQWRYYNVAVNYQGNVLRCVLQVNVINELSPKSMMFILNYNTEYAIVLPAYDESLPTLAELDRLNNNGKS